MPQKKSAKQPQYHLNDQGYFVIDDYNAAITFSSFFPGVAGLFGVPMWVFYVNRGQGIASFGIESKNKSIMEFQPANKAYRLASTQGFRTFIKLRNKGKTIYWEPFQRHLEGTDFRKTQTMSISAQDLVIEETNHELGLKVRVHYFTMPEESYSALVRRVSIVNIGKKAYDIEVIDGMPAIVPYGLRDDLNKHIARTAEAWVKVRNVKNKVPYYQLNVEIADTPVVTHIKEGNFFFGFEEGAKKAKLFDPLVESSAVFGSMSDFTAPENFLKDNFKVPQDQKTSNRTPCAMGHFTGKLAAGKMKTFVSLFGFAQDEKELSVIVKQVAQPSFIDKKIARNREIIDEIKNFAFTNSSSQAFNLYAGHTFLDNILRGGLPISLKTKEGAVAFNVYSRKHGDLERDYNFFFVSPTFYSQGNGNYRDVNQNRRNDVWFNSDVKENHVTGFLNLIQADGYNPLIVRGTTFQIDNNGRVDAVLKDYFNEEAQKQVRLFLTKSFMPGELFQFILNNKITVKGGIKNCMAQILEVCHKQESAEHGEGFWTDHWHYNMDLIESYLALYPEHLKDLLLTSHTFSFHQSDHYVLPRERRYVLTDRGVRQYHSVGKVEHAAEIKAKGNKLHTKQGNVYQTNLLTKLLCLVANKVSSLDPSGTGVEMEADKPNWYDSLNGLPGLLGSSINETIEIKRFSQFILDALNTLQVSDEHKVKIFEELDTFITSLAPVLSVEPDALAYWNKSNDIKEHYRKRIRTGIEGVESEIAIREVKKFLTLVIQKVDRAIESATDKNGFLSTYFYHEVTLHEKFDQKGGEKMPHVKPLQFKRRALPQFLEGYVHALRVEQGSPKAKGLYQKIRQSDLYDRKLKMYKVNANIDSETEEIGRTRIFPSGWLENESIWLHMEYKLLLELLRCGLTEEFYQNFENVLVPFMDPKVYGRNILENSSFIVSSAHNDSNLHGQGFVARLSGSTAEFLHAWMYMNVGNKPFYLNPNGELVLELKPALAGWLFTQKETTAQFYNIHQKWVEIILPKNTYAFNFLGGTLVVYHNSKRRNTYGPQAATVKEIYLTYAGQKAPKVIQSSVLAAPYSQDVRDKKVERIDVYLN